MNSINLRNVKDLFFYELYQFNNLKFFVVSKIRCFKKK